MGGEGFVTKAEFELVILRINKRLLKLRPVEVYGSNTYTKEEVDVLLALQDELSELGDVTVAAPVITQLLTYDGAKWVNAPAPSVRGTDFDEGILGEVIVDTLHALQKLLKLYDDFEGTIYIDEGVL